MAHGHIDWICDSEQLDIHIWTYYWSDQRTRTYPNDRSGTTLSLFADAHTEFEVGRSNTVQYMHLTVRMGIGVFYGYRMCH